ncbi:MAG: uroporphyrinogen-III synthase [Muribaculaceae bacterium]|nr:uroporphyrinogen-III synthase [Muribaculaceae bacterium]
MSIKKILVSQPKPANDKSPYFDIAKRHNVEIIFRPFIKVETISSKDFRQQKVAIPDYTAIIFTAKAAIDSFFKICEELRITIPDTLKYFCTTEQIALYLQKYIVYRKRKIFHGVTGKLDDPTLVQYIAKHHKEKFLFAVSDIHRDEPNPLDRLNIDYTKAVMYRTVSNDFAPDEKSDFDMMLFFSPAGIESLLKNFPDIAERDVKIGCFGNYTCQAVRDAGLTLDFSAPTPETPSMTAALDRYLTEHNK